MQAASARDRRYPAINQPVSTADEGIALIRSKATQCAREAEKEGLPLHAEQDLENFRRNSLQAARRCEELIAEGKDEIVWNVFVHFGIQQQRGSK